MHHGADPREDEAVVIEQSVDTFTAQGQTIVNASLTGQILPTEVATLLQVLATQASLIEAEELAGRIETLEQKLGVSK